MYKYTFVESKVKGILGDSNYQSLIQEYGEQGWRFITAIPKSFWNNNGQVKSFDLVFEKEV